MLQLKDIIRRTVTKQNMYCLLFVIVILMFATGLTAVVVHCGIHEHNLCKTEDDDAQPTTSDSTAVRLDVIFKAMFTFVVVFSVGATVSICLWVMWLRRAKQASTVESSTGKVKTGGADLCIMENDFVHSEYRNNNDDNNNKSLLCPDLGQSDE